MNSLSRTFPLTALLSLHLLCSVAIAKAAEQYELSDDSKVQEGVPHGEIKGPFRWENSSIFPGTERDYSIYIPAQYDADKPCCLLVVQDGLRKAQQWKFPTVLDNLIHKKRVYRGMSG